MSAIVHVVRPSVCQSVCLTLAHVPGGCSWSVSQCAPLKLLTQVVDLFPHCVIPQHQGQDLDLVLVLVLGLSVVLACSPATMVNASLTSRNVTAMMTVQMAVMRPTVVSGHACINEMINSRDMTVPLRK